MANTLLFSINQIPDISYVSGNDYINNLQANSPLGNQKTYYFRSKPVLAAEKKTKQKQKNARIKEPNKLTRHYNHSSRYMKSSQCYTNKQIKPWSLIRSLSKLK